jgi:hypothetical protein
MSIRRIFENQTMTFRTRFISAFLQMHLLTAELDPARMLVDKVDGWISFNDCYGNGFAVLFRR